MTSRFINNEEKSEQGAVLPLLVVITFALLLVIGLAIDCGNLFSSYLELQKAIDAGAVAGAKAAASRGKANLTDPQVMSDFQENIRATVENTVRSNFEWLVPDRQDVGTGYGQSKLQFKTINYELKSETVTVEAVWQIDLWFLKYFRGYGDFRNVRYTSHAQAQPAMINVVLDTSGSMICPASGTNCSCAPLCTGERKVDKLKGATANFVAQFNSWRDMIGMVWFSLGAKTAIQLNNYETTSAANQPSFDFGAFQYKLGQMPIQGATNQCDGLLRAYLDSLQVRNQLGRQNMAFVLFSDGAPTAARMFFSNPKLGTMPENAVTADTGATIGGDPSLTYDYYSWATSFRNIADLVPPASCQQPAHFPLIPGAMVLARAGTVPYDWDLGSAPGLPALFDCSPTPAPLGNSTIPCSQRGPDPMNPGDPNYTLGGCLNDFGFWTPRLPSVQGVTPPIPAIHGAARPFSEYRKQYYDCVVAMADFLRDTGGIVYTIGLGAPAPASSSDPYQVADSDSLRKDIFFRRIAYAPSGDADMARFPGNLSVYQPPNSAHLSRGEYYGLDNATNLNDTFQQLYSKIVRKIKIVELVHKQ